MNPFVRENIEGFKLAQNNHIDYCFDKLKKSYGQPKHIIEIGTCHGGFAIFLKRLFPEADIHTFDIVDWGDVGYIKKRNELFSELGIFYHNEDCFLRDGETIISLLRQQSILLCDGAIKESEFSYFINHIQSGSIIMAHDYGRNEDYFRKKIEDVYWNASFEFDGSKFDNECEEKGFIPYLQNDFEKAVWYIRKKI